MTYAFFVIFEPSLAGASAASDSIVVTQVVSNAISLTDAPDVSMSRALRNNALTAVGTSTWNVKTNNPTGYQLKINASSNSTTTCRAGTNPTKGGALCDTSHGRAFFDIATTTPKVWSSARAASDYSFGFSAFGTDTISVNSDEYAATGIASCSTNGDGNAINTTLKYRGFEGTNQFTVATRNNETNQAGASSSVCFAADQGGSVFAPSGSYKATITATAITI